MKTSTKILIGVASLFAVVWGVKMIGGSDNDNNNDNNHDIFTEVDSVEYRVMNDEAVVMGINRASMVVEEVHIRSEIEYNGRMLKVTSINESAFVDCGEIKAVYIPNSVTEIGKRAFDGCYSLNSIELPDRLTSINDEHFSSCVKLAHVNIPKGVTSIGDRAFSNCKSLTSITIPESVTSIADRAFSLCKGLTSINIPEGVTYIGEDAFSGCSNLTEMHLRHKKTLPDMGESEIDTSKVTLYVPTGCGKKYRKDPVFGRFKNIVEE